VPKSYDEFKRDLQEDHDEIKLTGSSKKFWVYLAKLVGEKKANQRREQAIERLNKVKCATRDGVVIETTRKELEKKTDKLKD
jgi:hypothetical protein